MTTRPAKASVEAPLWHALMAYRVLTLGYAIALGAFDYGKYERPAAAAVYLAALAVWTLATLRQVSSAERCTVPFLATDLAMALTGILLTPVVHTAERAAVGVPTLPTIWTAGAVLACAIKGGWRWAAVAATLVGIANVIQRGTFTASTIHNVLLLWLAGAAIGYVVEVARASERALARALQVEAATRERERLARSIHDSVLQVLAMVQRRGTAIGGEAGELGRLAGEQEAALRVLMSSGAPVPQTDPAVPLPAATAGPSTGAVRTGAVPGPRSGDADGMGTNDLRAVLLPYSGPRVSLAQPGTPVPLEPGAAAELAAAVGAALDNVRRHAAGPDGQEAQAWVLVEDEPDAVVVTVRDNGPGIPPGRLEDAEREGRMGVALSIRGRLRDLGGTADVVSVPGQGTEVELRLPRSAQRPEGGPAAERKPPAPEGPSAPETRAVPGRRDEGPRGSWGPRGGATA